MSYYNYEIYCEPGSLYDFYTLHLNSKVTFLKGFLVKKLGQFYLNQNKFGERYFLVFIQKHYIELSSLFPHVLTHSPS